MLLWLRRRNKLHSFAWCSAAPSLSFSLTFSLSLTHTHTDTRHSIGPNFQAFVHIEPLSLMSPSLTYLFSLCDIGFWNEGDQVSEYHAIPFSKGSSQPRNWTQVSCIAGRFFTIWATREAPCFDYYWLNLWPAQYGLLICKMGIKTPCMSFWSLSGKFVVIVV